MSADNPKDMRVIRAQGRGPGTFHHLDPQAFIGGHRRSSAFKALCLLLSSVLSLAAFAFDPVTPGKNFEFPRDAGAHPGHRLEWWYITGHLESDRGPMGFQVTFFRVRNPAAEGNASRFGPSQLLFVLMLMLMGCAGTAAAPRAGPGPARSRR